MENYRLVYNLLQEHTCNKCIKHMRYIRYNQRDNYEYLMQTHPELINVLLKLLKESSICFFICNQMRKEKIIPNILGKNLVKEILDSLKAVLLCNYIEQVLQSEPNAQTVDMLIDCNVSEYKNVHLSTPLQFTGETACQEYLKSVRALLSHGYRLDFNFVYMCMLAKIEGFNIEQLCTLLLDHDRVLWLQRYNIYVLYILNDLNIDALMEEAKQNDAVKQSFHLTETSSRHLYLLTDIAPLSLVKVLEKWWSKPNSNLKSFYEQNLKLNRCVSKPLYMSSLSNVFEKLAQQAVCDGEYEVVREYVNQLVPCKPKLFSLPSSLVSVSNKCNFKMCLVYLIKHVFRSEIIETWTRCGFDAAELDYFYDKSLEHDDIIARCSRECFIK